MRYREITTVGEWTEALERSSDKPLVVFKHSTQCPVSAGALDEFSAYLDDHSGDNVDYVFVKVIESRPVSNRIAEDTGVTHASPQLLYISGKSAGWHTSHWNITYSFLDEKLGASGQ